jgi:hypothetical protein
MKKFVVMSGGFHPFHAGHADLYQQAKEAFPDAKVLVCATNVQSDRPFPFSLKKKLAQLSGVPPKDFIEVSRQFTIQDPALAQRIGNPDDAIVIYVRSDKDRNEPPTPWKLGPDGKPPVGKRGAKKGLPLSDYLLEYPGKGQPLDPVSKHAYMAYLRTVEFGPGITSASEIRNAWPKLNAKRKLAMIMSLYPTTKSNLKLAQNVVGMFDQVMGVQENLAEGPFVPRIMHPKKVSIYLKIGKGSRLVATDISYDILDKYIQKVIQKYPQFKPTDFSFKASDKVDEAINPDNPWGDQGNFAGDTPVNIGGDTVKQLQVGDIVTYFGQKAKIEAMSKTGNTSRITIANKMGGTTQDVLTRDLKRTGMSEEIGGVGGGFGTNYPGTYEEENGPFTHKGGLKLTSLTTESVDYLDEK